MLTWYSTGVHLVFTWQSPAHQTIIWPSPDPYLTLIGSFKLKKSCLVGGGWWWVGGPTHYKPYLRVKFWRLTFDVDVDVDPDPDPELDKNKLKD